MEIVYADDLNAFRSFNNTHANGNILSKLKEVQDELHRWGHANRVTFDADKGSMHIISKIQSSGNEFRILGIDCDCKLLMDTAVHNLVMEASWKLKSILRTQRFFSTADLIMMFKAHILSFIEYRTPALLHVASSTLGPLEHLMEKLFINLGISDFDALMTFNLAPLSIRRDIAALGIIHRAMLGLGPKHFHQFFKLDPNPSKSSERIGGRKHHAASRLN